MKQKKVSVIVPMYNVDKYIEECLDSLLQQSYNNYEIILINDGSTDKTLEKCKKYENGKIRIINQSNQGVSIARNNGLMESRGEYILFVDADDVCSKKYIEKLVEALEQENNIDMAICNYTKIIEILDNEKLADNNVIIPSKNLLNEMIQNELKEGYLWNKIFKRSIIENNNIKFENNISVWEDLYFVLEYLLKANKVIRIKDILYYYRTREGSAINRKESLKGLKHKLKILELILKNICKYEDKSSNNVIKKLYITILLKILLIEYKEKIETKDDIKEKIKEIEKIAKTINIGVKNILKYIYLKIMISI